MAYNNNIPQPTDQLSDSQPQILANFQAIKTLVDVNHVTFDAAGQGKHKFVSMPVQGSAPATAAGEIALYSKTSALTGIPALFLRKQSNGVEVECASFTSTTGNSGTGWTTIPSGLKLKWGVGTTAAGVANVNVNASGITIGNLVMVQLTPSQNATVWVTNVAATSFTMASSVAVTNFKWFVIGT